MRIELARIGDAVRERRDAMTGCEETKRET